MVREAMGQRLGHLSNEYRELCREPLVVRQHLRRPSHVAAVEIEREVTLQHDQQSRGFLGREVDVKWFGACLGGTALFIERYRNRDVHLLYKLPGIAEWIHQRPIEVDQLPPKTSQCSMPSSICRSVSMQSPDGSRTTWAEEVCPCSGDLKRLGRV
jgi:hypothetical protein